MRKTIGKIMFGAGLLIGASLFIVGFLAYFISAPNRDGVIVDGLGRQLSLSPLFIRMVFDQDRLWAGLWWFIADMIIFWGGVGLAYLLITKGVNLSGNNK